MLFRSLTGNVVSNSQIDLSWTGATFPSSGATVTKYILLRAVAPSTPSLTNGNAAAPVAGANTTIVSSSIDGSATTYSLTNLLASTQYNFALIPYTYNGSVAATYNYGSAITASATTQAGLAQPTNLQFSSVSCSGLTGSYTASVSNPAGYIVLMSSGATAPNTDPSDAVTYTAGNAIEIGRAHV